MKRVVQIVVGFLAFALAWPMLKPLVRPDDSALAALGRIPVLEGGRVKPLDSVARSNLLILRGKQSASTAEGRISAMEWLAELIFNREAANALEVIRIDNPEILGMMGLEVGTRKYFSYRELEPYLARIQQQARQAPEDRKQRNAYESAIVQLFSKLVQYQILSQTVYPLSVRTGVPEYFAALEGSIQEAARLFASGGNPAANTLEAQRLRAHMQQLDDMARSPLFLLQFNGEWKTPGSVLREGVPAQGGLPEESRLLARLAETRQAGDAEGFAEAAHALSALEPAFAGAHPQLELYFNHSQPFIVALSIYVLVLLLVLLGWQFSARHLLGPAYSTLWLAFIIHTAGLILRVIITGYAPVTNLYSSAVFVGWVAVLLSLLFEHFQRKGVGSLAAATVGVLTLLVAHHLADSGDTMEKMRAVLNSNFWLSTHVITITMGYGATFLAGFLGLIYILNGWLRRGVSHSMRLSFHRMLYGAVAFSLLFSFVGTVLGGIWADQSWGRFWGWDPKENGALMIVLWTAMILHALRCGMIRTRGLVHLCIVGNVITAWSWFGTNMLGVGLHAYGFMDSAFFWLVLFWLSQFGIMFLEGLFPVRERADESEEPA